MPLLLPSLMSLLLAYSGGGAARVVAGVVASAGIDGAVGSVTISARLPMQYHDYC